MFGLFPKKKIRVHLEQGERVIAIGDIHGQKTRLKELISLVGKFQKKKPIDKETIVFLGDFVDRGPKSAEIVELLIARKKAAKKEGRREIFLQGNHETLLLECLNDEGTRHEIWWRNGGKETIYSYLKFTNTPIPKDASLPEIFKLFRDTFPKKHRRFLEKLKDIKQIGPLVFVHAGIRMDKKIKDQQPQDMHWIRDPFLKWKGKEKDFLVVHGHSITDNMKAQIHPHRIAIDTGGYKEKGRITAAIFEGDKVRFLSSGTKRDYKKNMFS